MDKQVFFSISPAIMDYIDSHNLKELEGRVGAFRQAKRNDPNAPVGGSDKLSAGKLSDYYHWHTGVDDISLWYMKKSKGEFVRFFLLAFAKHSESGTNPGNGNPRKQAQMATQLDGLVSKILLKMKKIKNESLNRTSKSTGYKPMKIITESTAPVSIQEAKTKASLYATAWGQKEVFLTLFEKFALVEAIEGEKGKFASIAFAINWPKTQKPETVTKTVMKCMTSTGDEIDMDMVIFDYVDISDVKVRDNMYAFKMNESVIVLEGSLGKCKRVAKSCAAALAATTKQSKMKIHMIESNATVSVFEKKLQKSGKLFTMSATMNNSIITTTSGLNESIVGGIADRNIMGCILEGVLSASIKAVPSVAPISAKEVKNISKRYGKKAVVESTEDSYEKWQEEVVAEHPEFTGKIKFVNKNDHNGKLIVSAQVGDRCLGVFDLDTEQGELLGEGTNIPSKNLLGSFRTQDGKTFTYGTTKNKWAVKNGLAHEIESGSKLEQNKFGNVKGNVAYIADGLDEASGKPTLTKKTIRHVWKNDVDQLKAPNTIDAQLGADSESGVNVRQELDEESFPKFKQALDLAKSEKAAGNILNYHVDTNGTVSVETDQGWNTWYDPKHDDSDDFYGGNDDRLDEDVSSFVIEYEIRSQDKTTQGKVTYQGNDQNEAKQRFLDDHKGDGQVTVKSVTAALAEDLSVTDSAIGVTGGQDSAYVVYADASGKKFKKLKHGTKEEITEEIESNGGKVFSIQDGKACSSKKPELEESLDQTELDKIIKTALDKAYVTATKTKEQYDRSYTDPDDEPFDFDEAVSDAFEAELQSIMDQLDDAVNDADDKVDGYMAGKGINESVVQPIVKTRQHHYADFITRFFGK